MLGVGKRNDFLVFSLMVSPNLQFLQILAYIYNVTLKVLPAYLVDNNFFMSMQIQPRFGWFRMKLPSIQRVPRWIVVLCRDR